MTDNEVRAEGIGRPLIEARLHSIAREADGIFLFEFRPERDQMLPAFEAGAHIDLHLSNGLGRSYSIINAQTERHRYVIAVKNEMDGRGGSRFMHGELRVGQKMLIGGPRNNFHLREESPHSVLIAGGIGITPLYSMIQRLEQRNRSWELHYACANREAAAFVASLERFGPSAHFYFKSDGPRADVLNIAELVRSCRDDADFYCCGPDRMMSAFNEATALLSAERVHAEYFAAARDEQATTGGFDVVLNRSGRCIPIKSGETILSALIDNGIDLPYSCMEGVCGSCQVGVLEGVPDHRDLIFSKQEREANDKILVCCSGSKTAKLVLDL